MHAQEYNNVNAVQPNAACFRPAACLMRLPCVRGSWKEVRRRALSVCGAMLRGVRRPSVVAGRVLGVPGGAVQALLLVRVVMCTEPSVMAEELPLLVPSKKRLSGQQKTESGTGRLEVLLCSYCLCVRAACCPMDAVDTGVSSKAGVFLRNELALKIVWNLS